ncbi:probable nuclear hormone receptor HR3 [Diadema antillarum]|uniref:probable nuclear hormone receptor HR3 n=1 Tax=Diadema antillarum TaxID=105358 RepID=UPI003A8688B7
METAFLTSLTHHQKAFERIPGTVKSEGREAVSSCPSLKSEKMRFEQSPPLSSHQPPTGRDTAAATSVSSSLPESPTWKTTSSAGGNVLTSSSAPHLTETGNDVRGLCTQFTPSHRNKSEDTCWVCGEKSNTFHYGILSCEGCKSFFARASQNHTSYNCPTKQCAINKETRNRCMYCRWKKCLAVGMSKKASKLGRRSKQLKAQIALNKPKTCTKSSSSDSGLDSPVCSPDDVSYHSTTPKQICSPASSSYSEFSLHNESADRGSRHDFPQHSPAAAAAALTTHTSLDEDQRAKRLCKSEDEERTATPITSPMSHQSLQWHDFSSVPLPSPATAWFSIPEDPQIEQLITSIHKAREESFIFQCKHDPNKPTPPAFDMASVRQGCHEVVIAFTPTLMDTMLGCMTDIIRRVVSFSKRLPGFCDLTIEDRTALIKNNMFEMVLVHASHLIDPNGFFVVMGDPHILLPVDLLRQVPFSETIVPLFRLSEKLQRLGLSARETSLMCAMSILSPDGEEIEQRDLVSSLQTKVLHALRWEVRNSGRVDPEDTFMHILIVLPMLREMNVMHRKMVSTFNMKMPGMFSDLHQEVFQ